MLRAKPENATDAKVLGTTLLIEDLRQSYRYIIDISTPAKYMAYLCMAHTQFAKMSFYL